jgi:flagellar biosynthesis/type III secretory pathway ATPase
VDEAKKLMPGITRFLRQDMNRRVDIQSSVDGLRQALGVKKPDK